MHIVAAALAARRSKNFSYTVVVDALLDGGFASSRDLDVVERVTDECSGLVRNLPQTVTVALDHALVDFRASLLDQLRHRKSRSLPRAESSGSSDHWCLLRSTHKRKLSNVLESQGACAMRRRLATGRSDGGRTK